MQATHQAFDLGCQTARCNIGNSQTGVFMCRNWCEVSEVAATADQLAQLQDDSSILITGVSLSPPKMSVRALLCICLSLKS